MSLGAIAATDLLTTFQRYRLETQPIAISNSVVYAYFILTAGCLYYADSYPDYPTPPVLEVQAVLDATKDTLRQAKGQIFEFYTLGESWLTAVRADLEIRALLTYDIFSEGEAQNRGDKEHGPGPAFPLDIGMLFDSWLDVQGNSRIGSPVM